jgi:hypothetical protein
MIAISTTKGELVKTVPFEDGKTMGFNGLYGFVSQDVFLERRQNRLRHGFRDHNEQLDFRFKFAGASEDKFQLEAADNCQVERAGDGWILKSGNINYSVAKLTVVPALPIDLTVPEKDRTPWIAALIALLVPMAAILMPKSVGEVKPEIVEQVVVQIKPDVVKPVEIKTAIDKIPEVKKQAEVAKRAIKQNLGFLGLLGKKELTKAVGGVPTDLKDVSPGAGPGGKEGSGGELLVGLGQGLKRTTVGNTGVAGLGGVGTHGAGGGAGGYGNSAIGSGEGKALSTMALSQELVLEGGLDRSVVQATIAKYLSQVRACYELGLKRNPGLGGQVTMAFEIGGAGDLNFAKVQKTSLDDSEVEQCISTRMMGWKFPKTRGGVSVKVSYPFVLRSTQT